VHSTPLVIVLVVCIVVLHPLVPPVVIFDVIVSIVTLSSFDVVVLCTHLSVVSVVCIVVLHLLVPPFVQVDACKCMLSRSVDLMRLCTLRRS
jgi:hypothetical protein